MSDAATVNSYSFEFFDRFPQEGTSFPSGFDTETALIMTRFTGGLCGLREFAGYAFLINNLRKPRAQNVVTLLVHDNISHEDILELEGLFLRICRRDPPIKLANVQFGSKTLKRLSKDSAWPEATPTLSSLPLGVSLHRTKDSRTRL